MKRDEMNTEFYTDIAFTLLRHPRFEEDKEQQRSQDYYLVCNVFLHLSHCLPPVRILCRVLSLNLI